MCRKSVAEFLLIIKLIQNWPHKGPFIANDAFSIYCILISFLAFLIAHAISSVLFISSQRRKAKECDCNIICPLMREKVSMMSTSKAIDQRNPLFCIGLKLRDFIRINDVLEITGDHTFSVYRALLRIPLSDTSPIAVISHSRAGHHRGPTPTNRIRVLNMTLVAFPEATDPVLSTMNHVNTPNSTALRTASGALS